MLGKLGSPINNSTSLDTKIVTLQPERQDAERDTCD
jgi:hypothetical protein